MLRDPFLDVCGRCKKRETCRELCAPVAEDIRAAGGKLYERPRRIGDHEVIVVFPSVKPGGVVEIQFANLPDGTVETDHTFEDQVREYVAVTAIRTGIFLDRLFNGLSFAEIADKYAMTEERARSHYRKAKDRAMELIHRLDAAERRRPGDMQKATGRLTKQAQAFLLAKCMDMTTSEIAEAMNVHHSNVSAWLRKMVEHVEAGRSPIIFEGFGLTGRSATSWELRRQ